MKNKINLITTELALSLFDITAKSISFHSENQKSKCFKLGLEYTVSFKNDRQTPAPFTEWKC